MLEVPKKKRRVHSLTGRITHDLLLKAFKAVRKNRGAAGVDKQSIEMFEANLVPNLRRLERELKDRSYRPPPLRRVYIEKDRGKFRPLGIPTVGCRVAQEVVRRLLNPIFEKTFHDNSYGYRRNRSCHHAIERMEEYRKQGYTYVIDADIKGFFDEIPQKLIMDMVTAEVSDGNILGLVKKFLQAGVMEDGHVTPTRKGTPQGGVISPLLANTVLNHLDWTLDRLGYKFVRYADDFVVLCRTRIQAEKALEVIRTCVEEDLGLTLSTEKTKIARYSEGFQFLGFLITSYGARMSPKAEARFKDKIRKLTHRHHNLDRGVIERVNRVLRGTANYYHASFTTTTFQLRELDKFVRRRIRCMKFKRISREDNRRSKNKHLKRLGLLALLELRNIEKGARFCLPELRW
jgi:group II intron reverse transcriptase/maturase